MGLENLKSIFSNIEKQTGFIENYPSNYDPNVGGIHGGLTGDTPSKPDHPSWHTRKMTDTLGHIGSAVDYINSPILGFTLNMNSKDKSELSPFINERYTWIPPTKTIEQFGTINHSVDYIDSSIKGFTLNMDTRQKSELAPYDTKTGIYTPTITSQPDTIFDTRTISIDPNTMSSPKLGFDNFTIKDTWNGNEFGGQSRVIQSGFTILNSVIQSPFTEPIIDSLIGKSNLDPNTFNFRNFSAIIGQAQKGYQIYNVLSNKTLGLDSIQNLFGISDVSVEDGALKIKRQHIPPYQDTVYELQQDATLVGRSKFPLNNNTELLNQSINPDEWRGIAFQVLGKQNLLGYNPDFTYQDIPENVITISLQDPLIDFNPGAIKFTPGARSLGKAISDYYGPKIKEGINELKNLQLKEIINIPDFSGITFPDINLPDLPNIKFPSLSFSKNEQIEELIDKIGGWWDEYPTKWGKSAGIAISKRLSNLKASGWFPESAGGISSFSLGDVGGSILEFGSDVKDFGIFIGKGISKTATFLMNEVGTLDIDLPTFKNLRSPFLINISQFGGEGQLKKNQPRSLTRYLDSINIPGDINVLAPAGHQPDNDRKLLKGKEFISTPYSMLGAIKYTDTGQVREAGGAPTDITVVSKMPPRFYPYKLIAKGGDPINRGPSLIEVPESQLDGMPLYFKDLRGDKKVIVFRGYVEGITEDISPSWASENYIGRSEPVYIYEQAERSINFALKLIADHELALDAIYGKMKMLSSLCYPEYAEDKNISGKTRMKPPLVKFRMGELYGKPNDEVLGFIQSLSYNFPDESPWEFRNGMRVPKYITVAISFQVIHASVPDINTDFYGYSKTTSTPTVLNRRLLSNLVSNEDIERTLNERTSNIVQDII